MARADSFKARVRGGDLLVGTFVKTAHPSVTEVLANSPLDFICFDAEHAPFDRRDLDVCLMAARAGDLPALVRPPVATPSEVLNALDLGAVGVLAPHIRAPEQATALVRSAHFGPNGRGVAASPRATFYGAKKLPHHLADSAARTTVIAQIEDADAIPAAGAIAGVAGLDAIFLGPADLTVSLDCQSPGDPPVVAAMEAIARAGRAAGGRVGMFLSDPSELSRWQAVGVSLFIIGSDHGFLRSGARALMENLAGRS